MTNGSTGEPDSCGEKYCYFMNASEDLGYIEELLVQAVQKSLASLFYQ